MRKLTSMIIIILFLLTTIAYAENHEEDRIDQILDTYDSLDQRPDTQGALPDDYADYKMELKDFDDRRMMIAREMMNSDDRQNYMREGNFRDFRDEFKGMPFPEENYEQIGPGISRPPEMWRERFESFKSEDEDEKPWFAPQQFKGKGQEFEQRRKMMEEKGFNEFTPESMMDEIMIFSHQQINPKKDLRELMIKKIKEVAADEQQCHDSEQLVEKLYLQFDQEINDFKQQCRDMNNGLATCRERMIKVCEMRSQGFDRGMDPMMSQCPPNKEKMIQTCLEGSARDGDERCEQEWELNQEQIKYACQSSENCDEDRFIQSCMNSHGFKGFDQEYREEDRRGSYGQREGYDEREERYDERPRFEDRERYQERGDNSHNQMVEQQENDQAQEREEVSNKPSQDISGEDKTDTIIETLTTVTGNAIYENEGMKDSCQQRWKREKERCEEQRAHCSKDSYLKLCMKRANPGMEDTDEIQRYHCQRNINERMPMMERFCSMKLELGTNCKEQAERMCTNFAQQAEQCQKQFDEEALRTMLRRAIEYHCKLKTSDDEELAEESDVRMVKQMMDLMEEEVPEDDLEMKMTDMLTVMDEGKALEQAEQQKPFWYKLRRFFGLLEEQEKQREISAVHEIRQNIQDLDERIADLTAIMAELDKDITKQKLQEQISKLELQKNRLKKQEHKLARLQKTSELT